MRFYTLVGRTLTDKEDCLYHACQNYDYIKDRFNTLVRQAMEESYKTNIRILEINESTFSNVGTVTVVARYESQGVKL